MIPRKQLFRHKPDKGIYGDCHRACVASILNLPCEAVPNFCAPLPGEEWVSGRWREREREWLLAHGYCPITMTYSPDATLEQVLEGSTYYNQDIYWILGGTSRNGTGHSVVAYNGEIVHDPSLDDSGIIGPMEDGHYWATFIGSAIAVKVPHEIAKVA